MRRFFALLLLLSLASAVSNAATNFPYANARLSLPGGDDPYPGLGSYSSSLGSGIRTVLWNPAGIMKIKEAEGMFGVTSTAPHTDSSKGYKVDDISFEATGSGGTSGNLLNAILFTSDPNARTVVASREFTGSAIFTPQSSGMDFRQAIRVNDWCALGITSRGDTDISLAVAGNMPAQYFSEMNLYDTHDFLGTGISVNPAGFLTYRFGTYVHTSEASIWSDFVRQEQRIPFGVVTEMRNNMNVRSDLTFTGGTRWGNLSAGLNFTPVSARMNIDNTAKMIVQEGAADPFYYMPNFDPNDELDVIAWMSDPARYASESGYIKRYVRVPAGESVGEAKYTGFFEAATMRTDLGFHYDLGEAATLGLALENFGGGALNFRGTGRVAYVNHRLNTEGDFDPPIDPADPRSWSPFTDTFSTVEGTEGIGMLESFNMDLPQRTRLGLTLRRPILIYFDYEMQNNPFTFAYRNTDGDYVTARLSNIRILRGGLETQVFVLPWWIRLNGSVMMKPDAEGLDAESAESFDKAFPLFGQIMPHSGDISTRVNLWGYYVGGATGFDAGSVLSLVQLDTLKGNIGKVLYYNLSLNKDNWHVTLQNTLDPISTAGAVANAPKEEREDLDFGKAMKYLRWTSTLAAGFTF